MNRIFEALMLISFGAAWPASIHRSWVSRQTGGKSVVFMYIVLAGYAFGVVNKLINGVDYVLAFYILDVLLVSVDLVLYYRNKRIEEAAQPKG
ncbi:MAG: hypothetical protein P4L75_00940 [Clostridia bacterium]|nr:hypothetical protein [Clostridia bacterium]MDR3644417.1 hypothetical protein [Clostridia bacterium]